MSRKLPAALGTIASIFSSSMQVPAFAVSLERVSVSSSGEQANDFSLYPSISANGRYVAFQSSATNLVPDDGNGSSDVFVRDRQVGRTWRVSLADDGAQANDSSLAPSISADGRFVAFESEATNLVPGDSNGALDVFVRDLRTGKIERVSVGSDGRQANGDSGGASISADGRYVAFVSDATNLVSGDTNGSGDVFVHDRQTARTERVSVRSGNTQSNGDSSSPSITGDGRYVAYYSNATNLVAGDVNRNLDVFVRDRRLGRTTQASISTSGTHGNLGSAYPSISADGRFVAFESEAMNLVPGDSNGVSDVFVRDRWTNRTKRVSIGPGGMQANDFSNQSSISADGRYVAFGSSATNLVKDFGSILQIYVHDRVTWQTKGVSIKPDGSSGDGNSITPSISANGQYISFASFAGDLVPGDTNGTYDVFVYSRYPRESRHEA